MPRTQPRSLRALVVLTLLSATAPVLAHINVLRGRLVDLARQSDLVIVGIVTLPASLSPSHKHLTIDVVETIRGKIAEKSLTASTNARLIAGERQVIFLKREGGAFRCVQPSGTRFPTTPEEDADYRRTIVGIATALKLPENQQVDALRAVLIPTLNSSALPLRYHAALQLTELNHEAHPLTANEREAIEAVRNTPGFDPTLTPVIDALLRGPKPRL